MKLKKYIAMFLVATTIMIGTITNAFAVEQQLPQISPWAIGILNEGEKYGIFPITWYYDDFQQPITKDKLQTLIQNTSTKIATLGMEENSNYVAKQSGTNITKDYVITALYNTVAKYKLPENLEIAKYSPVNYFQRRAILNGTDKGLELNELCTVEQATILATKLVEDTYNAVEAGSKGLLWKATKGDNTIYLLGSIHIGNTELYPFNQTLKNAFKESDSLIIEANTFNNPQGMQDFIQIAMYSDGTTLKDHVSEETYNKAIQVFDKYNLPKDQYIKFKPWSIANDLSVIDMSNSNSLQDAAQAATLGIDMYFITSAITTAKPIVELEGLKYQAELFDGLSSETQEMYLNNSLDSILNTTDSSKSESAQLTELWQKQWQDGNISDFITSYTKAYKKSQGEITQMLLGERDKNMTEKLSTLLEKEGKSTYFVVVGVAHLTMENTVVEQLKAKGYDVQIVD